MLTKTGVKTADVDDNLCIFCINKMSRVVMEYAETIQFSVGPISEASLRVRTDNLIFTQLMKHRFRFPDFDSERF